MGVEEDWVCFDVEKEYGGEEDVVIWPHCPEERYGEKTDAREDGRQAEKGQTATTWFEDFKEWAKLDIAAASQLVTDREIWRKIIKATAAQIAPPDWRERHPAHSQSLLPLWGRIHNWRWTYYEYQLDCLHTERRCYFDLLWYLTERRKLERTANTEMRRRTWQEQFGENSRSRARDDVDGAGPQRQRQGKFGENSRSRARDDVDGAGPQRQRQGKFGENSRSRARDDVDGAGPQRQRQGKFGETSRSRARDDVDGAGPQRQRQGKFGENSRSRARDDVDGAGPQRPRQGKFGENSRSRARDDVDGAGPQRQRQGTLVW